MYVSFYFDMKCKFFNSCDNASVVIYFVADRIYSSRTKLELKQIWFLTYKNLKKYCKCVSGLREIRITEGGRDLFCTYILYLLSLSKNLSRIVGPTYSALFAIWHLAFHRNAAICASVSSVTVAWNRKKKIYKWQKTST